MSVSDRLSETEIQEQFTHFGFFCSIVPIYFNEETSDIAVRNWYPEWLLDFAVFLFRVFSIVTPVDCGFPILITGQITRKSGAGHAD
jgi:hypothetical protein